MVFFPLTFMTRSRQASVYAAGGQRRAGAGRVVPRVAHRVAAALLAFLAGRRGAEARFPRWLFFTSLAAAIVGLGLPALAVYGTGLLDQYFPRAVGDVVAWPYTVLPGTGQIGLVIVGVTGFGVIALAACSRAAPPFQRIFDLVERFYAMSLRFCLRARLVVLGVLVAAAALAVVGFFHLGQELFPEVDSSEFTIHLRMAGGPRVETTEQRIREIDGVVHEIVPQEDLKLTMANIGLSSRWSAIYTPNNGPHAGFLRVQLRSGFDGRHTPTSVYADQVRQKLAERFPSDDFFFETGGMIRQILNGGSLAPIEVQVHGRDTNRRRAVAKALDWRIGRIPLVKETYLPQGMDLPQLKIEVDRDGGRPAEADANRRGSQRHHHADVERPTAPNFWIDPKTGRPVYHWRAISRTRD